MTDGLLNCDLLFQNLLSDGLDPNVFEVAADLDVDSIDMIPFVTHSSLASQIGNADGVWDVTLTIHIFAEASVGFAVASDVYDVVKQWGKSPTSGVVPAVGGIESVDDASALTRRSGTVQMSNKYVVQFDGTFNLTVKKL